MWSKTAIGCRDIPTDKERIRPLMTKNSNSGSNILWWMGWKYLHSFLEYFVCIICCYIHCYFVLFNIASAAFLWISLWTIAIQPTTIIRGLVKIKYTEDQCSLLTDETYKYLISAITMLWPKYQPRKSRHLYLLTYHWFVFFLSTYFSFMQITKPYNVNFL